MSAAPHIDYRFTADLRQRIRAHLTSFKPTPFDLKDLRHAAVGLVLVANETGHAGIILTRRLTTLRRHSGQWALPGGRLDPGESAETAALREIHEEIGLDLDRSAVLGRLDDYATRSGHLISPFVVWGGPDARLQVNPEEVDAAFHIPLADLDHPRALQLAPLLHFQVPSLPTTLHAPTAAIVYQFREVSLHGRDVSVAEVEQPYFAWS
ncbi:MAG TPA: CoA pyrophosphatase [Phenylobacterium sp.]